MTSYNWDVIEFSAIDMTSHLGKMLGEPGQRPCVGDVVTNVHKEFFIVCESHVYNTEPTIAAYFLDIHPYGPPTIDSEKHHLDWDGSIWCVSPPEADTLLGWSGKDRSAAFWAHYDTAHAAQMPAACDTAASASRDANMLVVPDLPSVGDLVMSAGPVTQLHSGEEIHLQCARNYVVTGKMILADAETVVLFGKRAELSREGMWEVGAHTVVLRTWWPLNKVMVAEDPSGLLRGPSRSLFTQWHPKLGGDGLDDDD